jgi:hypothetical protein
MRTFFRKQACILWNCSILCNKYIFTIYAEIYIEICVWDTESNSDIERTWLYKFHNGNAKPTSSQPPWIERTQIRPWSLSLWPLRIPLFLSLAWAQGSTWWCCQAWGQVLKNPSRRQSYMLSHPVESNVKDLTSNHTHLLQHGMTPSSWVQNWQVNL